MKMKISPKYTVEDWRKIDFDTEEGWQKAVDIFEDRIKGRFLEPISYMINYRFAGFAIMALDCLLIETLQQFFKGVDETPRGKSKEYFIKFLSSDSSFKEFFDEEKAEMFYDHIRCGILHQAETKGTTIIHIRQGHLVDYTEDRKGLSINRNHFHEQLEKEFRNYIDKLRDREQIDLRKKFKRKMDYICRVNTIDRKIKYFAYGSNMLIEKIKKVAPSAQPVARAKLIDYRLVFNKKSIIDGSSKANITESKGDVVWGVLYEINEKELNKLDKMEKGYQRSLVDVIIDEEKIIKAYVYISSKITNSIPNKNYMENIIKGAIYHHLPSSYIEFLKNIIYKSE